MTETTLDQHLAVMGRVIAKFVSGGLMAHNIVSRGVEDFLGAPEDKEVFEAVLVWRLRRRFHEVPIFRLVAHVCPTQRTPLVHL